MKKITIFALHLGYGGIEQYISSLCKMLENDFNIEIISTYKVLDKPAFEFSDKIKIKYLIEETSNRYEFINYVKHFKLISTFKEGLKSLKIIYYKYYLNIKVIKNLDTDYIITTRTFHNKLVSKYANNKIVKIATDHNHHNGNNKYINNLIKSCKNFDYFIAISPSLYKTYKAYFKKIKCIYIPNVLDELPNRKSTLNNNSLISIGRLSKEKGFIDLISIINSVKNKIPNIKLNLIGDGNQKVTIENKIRELNLENNIIVHGYLNKKEIEKYMLDSSIYIMTSYTESFGLVLLESFSYGLPCIAFDSAIGAKELIESNNGILISNRDKEKMANEIIRLINNKNQREVYGKNNRKKAEEYLAKNIKDKWLSVLKDED